MGGAKKPKGGGTLEEQAMAKAQGVDDIDDEDYKKSVRLECRALQAKIKGEEQFSLLFNDQRLRINYFWLISKKELEDKAAELRNKERELQDLSEKHQIELKIYRQRCKHLIFNNLDQLTDLKKEAQITLKNVEDENRVQERELKQDVRAIKVSQKEQEIRHKEYLNALQKEKMKQQTELRAEFERISNEIHLKSQHKMTKLRSEMVSKRKAEIKKIQEEKDAQINRLTKHHEKKYQEMITYFKDITQTNVEIINQLRDELSGLRKDNAVKEREKMDQQEANNKVVEPLNQANQEVIRLKKTKLHHDTIMGSLGEVQEGIAKFDGTSKEIEWQYEVRLQQFQYLERERQELFDEFHRLVYEIHQKTGIRNLILEKKHETIQESLETKDAQINQLLAAAKIDPQALGIIRTTLEEVENLKSDAIREIQASLKKIREAHSNMVKTYEGKLSEFGIPVEELGFDPLVPANI